MELKLEAIVIPVSDMDRAKQFYKVTLEKISIIAPLPTKKPWASDIRAQPATASYNSHRQAPTRGMHLVTTDLLVHDVQELQETLPLQRFQARRRAYLAKQLLPDSAIFCCSPTMKPLY